MINNIDNEYRQQGYIYIAGTDEAGRGPLAGPVVACAVIFPPRYENPLIDDSKKLSEKVMEVSSKVYQAQAEASQKEAENTFRVVAEAWLYKRELEQKQDEETIRRLKHDVYPYIGDFTFPQLTLEILEIKVFKRIIERGALSVAKRLKSDLNQIFKSARKKKLIQYNLNRTGFVGDQLS